MSGRRASIANAVFISGQHTKRSSCRGKSKCKTNRILKPPICPDKGFVDPTSLHDPLCTMANKLFRPFLWIVIGCGSLAFLYSATRLDLSLFDSRFAVLLGVALILTSRITIPLPRFSSQISVSDTFVFLVLLLYGIAVLRTFAWSGLAVWARGRLKRLHDRE